MKNAIYSILIILACSCKPQNVEDANPRYSQNIEDRISRVTENLKVGTQFWNQYKNSTLEKRLKHYKTPGISIAVINNGKVEWARGFGYRNLDSKEPVTQNTLFQVASISKPIVALAFIKLMENDEIDIDTNVNAYLKSWKIPSNNGWEPEVTLRQLLSHTAGTTVSGFPGYLKTEEIPTTVQILNGEYPTNTNPVLVNIFPGSLERYSGGGITVAQLVLEDMFDKPFYMIMDSLVLSPLNLTTSTYQQPIPKSKYNLIATGYPLKYQPINGGHHIYPEMAAAGLWTTPKELSNIVIELQQAIQGNSTYIKAESINEMLKPQKIAPDIGIGFFLNGSGDSLLFTHSGGNYGFNSILVGYKSLGKGAIVMINANTFEIINEVMRSIATEYDWPDYFKENKEYTMDEELLKSYIGKYSSEEDWEVVISKDDEKLTLEMAPQPPVYLIAEGNNKFYSDQININVEFIIKNNDVEGLVMMQDGWKKTMKRRNE